MPLLEISGLTNPFSSAIEKRSNAADEAADAPAANVPFVILVERLSDLVYKVALREQFADIYEHPADINDFITRADYLIKNPEASFSDCFC